MRLGFLTDDAAFLRWNSIVGAALVGAVPLGAVLLGAVLLGAVPLGAGFTRAPRFEGCV